MGTETEKWPSVSRLLSELSGRQRVHRSCQDFLLGLQIHAEDHLPDDGCREPAAAWVSRSVSNALLDLKRAFITQAGTWDGPELSLSRWAAELRAAGSPAIYSVRRSSLQTFARAAEQQGLDDLVEAVRRVAGALSLLPRAVLKQASQKGRVRIVSPDGKGLAWADLRSELVARRTAARDQLVESYLGYAVRLASKYVGRGVPFEDLVQEAADGLLEAAPRFDPWGKSFKVYGTTWAWQRIQKSIADHGHPVRLPLNRQRRRGAVEEALEGLVRAGIGTPQPEDLMLWLNEGCSVSQRWWVGHGYLPGAVAATHEKTLLELELLLQRARPCLEVNGAVVSREGEPEVVWADVAVGGRAADEECLQVDHALSIQIALSTLPERDAYILRRYYGLDGEDSLTLEEIGRELDLTRERVRQLRVKAAKRLKTLAKKNPALLSPLPDNPPPDLPIPSETPWAVRRIADRRRLRRELTRLLSANLESYRGERLDKSVLRRMAEGEIRSMGGPVPVERLASAIRKQLAERGSWRAPDAEYVRALLTEAADTFVPTGGGAWSLVALEADRAPGETLPTCPPWTLEEAMHGGLALFLARGRVATLTLIGDRPDERSMRRHGASVWAYLLGLSPYMCAFAPGSTLPPAMPPSESGERAWEALLSTLSRRLEGMDIVWAILRDEAPISVGTLGERAARESDWVSRDVGHRIAALEALGAVRRGEGGLFWLTARGLACAESYGRDESTVSRAEALQGESMAMLSDEERDGLVDQLLGL